MVRMRYNGVKIDGDSGRLPERFFFPFGSYISHRGVVPCLSGSPVVFLLGVFEPPLDDISLMELS